ncbi:MAG: tyrosine-type recombinase/integrase [Candidatus Nanoarchaeia archaeon]|nr:tyrosine-type recombinase/integrase [Candidatus Nanoarchaeia archaeon]MDD5741656.1 tyrosine-type recombinase/integrase [Candidatus Nanoarchaeia archaeon]
MKQKIRESYKGEIDRMIKRLPEEDKKVIEDYYRFRRTNASDDKCRQYKVKLTILRDTAETLFKNFKGKEIIEKLLITIKNSPRNDKIELRKLLKNFIDWKFNNPKLNKLIKCGTPKPNREKINKNKFPTDEELQKMFLACKNLKEKAMLCLQEELGLRPQETLNLKWKDCKFNDDNVVIQINGTKSLNSIRVLPAVASKIHLLRWKNEFEYPDIKPEDYVFPSKNRNKPYQRQYLDFLYDRICKRAGIRSMNPYDLRHRRLTNVWEKTQDLQLTSKMGGHSIKVCSDFYQHSSLNDIKDLIMEKVYDIEELTPEQKNKYEKELGEIKTQLSKEGFERKKLQKQIKEIQEADRLHKETVVKAIEILEDSEGNLKPELEKRFLEEELKKINMIIEKQKI